MLVEGELWEHNKDHEYVYLEEREKLPTPRRPLWPYVVNGILGLVLSVPGNPIYRLLSNLS